MSYVVSSLTNYTNEPADKLIYDKLFAVVPTLDYCEIQTGIKSAETINLLSSTAYWQSQACGFNASGADAITQRTITVGKPKVDKKWCERDLEPKYTQKKLKKGGNYDSLAFNTELIDSTTDLIAVDLEQAIWMGDTGNPTHNLVHFDGFVKILNADIPAANKYSGTTWSEANSRTAIKGLAAKVVANANVWKGGMSTIKFFMSPAMAQAYRWKLTTDNLGFGGAYQAENAKTFVEGTSIEIVEVPGLSGTNYIYAIEPENMFFGTDMENEQEKYKVWYSQDNDEIRFHAEFKAGVQVAFPSRCFSYLGV